MAIATLSTVEEAEVVDVTKGAVGDVCACDTEVVGDTATEEVEAFVVIAVE